MIQLYEKYHSKEISNQIKYHSNIQCDQLFQLQLIVFYYLRMGWVALTAPLSYGNQANEIYLFNSIVRISAETRHTQPKHMSIYLYQRVANICMFKYSRKYLHNKFLIKTWLDIPSFKNSIFATAWCVSVPKVRQDPVFSIPHFRPFPVISIQHKYTICSSIAAYPFVFQVHKNIIKLYPFLGMQTNSSLSSFFSSFCQHCHNHHHQHCQHHSHQEISFSGDGSPNTMQTNNSGMETDIASSLFHHLHSSPYRHRFHHNFHHNLLIVIVFIISFIINFIFFAMNMIIMIVMAFLR